jgi:predicted transcriptional regulator of viral defense system
MGDMLLKERPRPDREGLFQLASGQQGYFTAGQASLHGFSHALLAYHARTGMFRRIRPGLYRFRDYPSTPREELMAAWLALGGPGAGAVVSHESALDLWAITDAIPHTNHFSVPRNRRHLPRIAGVTVHTTSRPFARDDLRVLDGLYVTSPARTLLDLAESQGVDDGLRQSLYRAARKGWVTRGMLNEKAAGRGPRAKALAQQPFLAELSVSQGRKGDGT